MIEIRNMSNEPYVLVPIAKPDAPGFRLAEDYQLPPMELDPGNSVVLTGYEPGVMYEIRPVHDAAQPRSGFAGVREG